MSAFSRSTGPFSAVIFDFDGVLIDTEPLYLRTVNEVLAEAGAAPLSAAANVEFIGKPAGYTWASLRTMFDLPQPTDYYQDRYDALLVRVLERHLTLRPEARTLLKEVESRGLRRGLATSSRRKWVEIKLRLLGLSDFFQSVVSAEDVGGKAKPEPDVYVHAARQAGIDVPTAMAIEDSPAGIAAAKAAGLYTIALRTTSTIGLDLSHADRIVDSLNALDPEDLFVSGAAQSRATAGR